jgi:hypothetical protein
MLMVKERRPAYRTLERWAIGVLLAAGRCLPPPIPQRGDAP